MTKRTVYGGFCCGGNQAILAFWLWHRFRKEDAWFMCWDPSASLPALERGRMIDRGNVADDPDSKETLRIFSYFMQ